MKTFFCPDQKLSNHYERKNSGGKSSSGPSPGSLPSDWDHTQLRRIPPLIRCFSLKNNVGMEQEGIAIATTVNDLGNHDSAYTCPTA